MIGGRKSARPTGNPDIYEERLNASLSVYNAEPAVPATSFATIKSPLKTNGFASPTIGPKVRAFFKDSRWRMNGIINAWSWGAINMGPFTNSLPGSRSGLNGMVRSTDFQTDLVRLHDWQLNTDWYIAYNATGGAVFNGSNGIRYQYPSFRTPQPQTRLSGGPGPVGMAMQPRPRFKAVQAISKYTTRPRYYDTRSAGVPRNPRGGASNVNGPGTS